MITKAERRVLAMVADGLGNRQIVRRLHWCGSAASTTMCRIYRKLGLSRLPRAEQRRRAIWLYFTGEAMR